MDFYQSAVAYLSRYSASAEQVRRVLQRRARRHARKSAGDFDMAEADAAIEQAVTRLMQLGLLNDSVYASSFAQRQWTRGRSKAYIRSALSANGISRPVIDSSTGWLSERQSEVEACAVYARRRRLGPFRTAVRYPDQHKRDIATLCRAGFAFDVAEEVVGKAAKQSLKDQQNL